jgi:ABC-type transport system involved in cytochrome c biogenesis permease subunit
MVLGLLFHIGADVTRGIAAGRVPWSNMYEFSLTGTMLIVLVYLVVLIRYDLRFLGAFISGLVVLLMGGAMVGFYVPITPLMDPLKSVWLVIHVFVASLSTALFAIAFGLSVAQLMQARHPVCVAVDRRLRRGDVQLHHRQHVLQGPARLQRSSVSRSGNDGSGIHESRLSVA